jgi:hypothetical protein
MPYQRKNPADPLMPVDFRGKAGIALAGNRVYNGASRAPNPQGNNQYPTMPTINNLAQQQVAANKAKLLANKKRLLK